MTNNPTARAPNPDRLTPPGVLASIPTRQEWAINSLFMPTALSFQPQKSAKMWPNIFGWKVLISPKNSWIWKPKLYILLAGVYLNNINQK